MHVLVHLLDAAPSLALLYADPIIKVLEEQARTADTDELLLAAFSLTRRMAVHAGSALKPKAMFFATCARDALRDQTSIEKRRGAVVTLMEVVAGTACMSEVALLRDDFIELLISHLKSETDTNARRDTVKALGVLGASRPSLSGEDLDSKILKELNESEESASKANSLESGLLSTDPEILASRVPVFIADFVLCQLMDIWKEPSLKIHHPAVSCLPSLLESFPDDL